MKYALNFETEALSDATMFDEFAEESTNSFWELDEYSDHECELCSEFDPKYDESEWEAEVMRGRRVPQRTVRPPPRSQRSRLRPRIIRRPGQVIGAPSICTCPAPNCPRHGSEYVRWVQSALNQIMNLRLSVTGIMNAPTRSALRSFQEKQGLPVDGIAGPETKEALVRERGGKSASSQGSADRADANKSVEPVTMEPAPSNTAKPAEPEPMTPASEFYFEWETFDDEFEGAEGIYEAESEWFVLGSGCARLSAGAKVGDREVGETLHMAAKKVRGIGITLEELFVRHQAESGGIPIEVLLAFIHFEAGKRLFDDATAGKWSDKYKKYIPSFYELGVFQTPGGVHGCIREGYKKRCAYQAPGHNIERSQFGKGWYRLKQTYPTKDNWRDPTMQVRIGLWDLNSTGERIAKVFPALFPSRRSEWYLRMAVLYSFAHGAGWTRAFLSKYRNQLLALQESQRWDFLRGKRAYLKGRGTTTFTPENVDKKMTLAAKLRAVRGATVTQPPADRGAGTVAPSPSRGLPASGSRPVLRRGSRGTAVKEIQNRLTALGFNSGPADGIFGSQTEEAVKAFQGLRGLAADGIVGSQTWGQLYARPGTGGAQPSPTPSPVSSVGEPQVTIDSNVLVSGNAVRILKDILRMAGLRSARITSGRRTPNDQARIMYDLIERNGVSYAKNLYGSSGDKVIDVYSTQKSASMSATAIKQAMEAKINQLGCHNVSHHCSVTHDVIDVAPSSIADQNAFRLALDATLKNGTIDKYIGPPEDPAFHIEIILSPTANELTSRILRSPPLPLDAFLPREARFEMD